MRASAGCLRALRRQSIFDIGGEAPTMGNIAACSKCAQAHFLGSSCMTVGGFPPHKFAWPLFYGLLSRSSGPRNFD